MQFLNISFEEWNLDAKKFNAVLAATSIHWISPEIAYPKIANILQDDGVIILLWNLPAILPFETHQVLQEVYQVYAPSLSEYKGQKTHEAELKKIEQIFLNSGQFTNITYSQILWNINYSVDEYLTLLSSFSQYLELETQTRNTLFEKLRDTINEKFADNLKFSNLSAFHIGWKI